MAKVDTPDAPQVVGPKGPQPPRPARAAKPLYEAEPQLLEDVPRASLDGPVGRAFDLSPSPVPRVSLHPPTESLDDESGFRLAPHPASRHLPTVAARYLAPGAQASRSGAPAATAPPRRRSGKLVARRLVEDVRSSKREVVLGLIIGIGLSALLGVVVKRYLDRPYVGARGSAAPAPPVLTTDQLGLEPDLARTPPPSPLELEPALTTTEVPERASVRDTSAAELGSRAPERAPRSPVSPAKPRRKNKKPARSAEAAAAEQGPPAAPPRPAQLSPSERAGLGLELPL